jgi:ubiquinone/menaquinone biosynthesis C-methylase UbiE
VGPHGRVIGVDASLEMIRLSRGTPRYAVALAQIPGLPFPDETFDAVTAGFVVSHFPDVRAGLQDLRRVCRAGCQIAMSAWGSRPNAPARLWSDIAATFVPREDLDQAFRAHIPWDEYFSRKMNLQRAFEEAGLQTIHAETRDYEISMATSDFLLSRDASIQGMVLRRRLSIDDRQAFGRRVADAFQREFADAVTYVRDVHFVVGTKSRG